jgi:hypothetical protein
MHKGLQYPYKPNFWSPTGFFWPYFAPWKWQISACDFNPFGVILVAGTPNPFISEAVVDLSADMASWTWPMPWAVFWDEVKMTIYCETHLGTKYMQFHFQILLAGVEVSGGYFPAEPYLFADNFPGIPFYTTPYGPYVNVGSMSFNVASYAQGGSPWPS